MLLETKALLSIPLKMFTVLINNLSIILGVRLCFPIYSIFIKLANQWNIIIDASIVFEYLFKACISLKTMIKAVLKEYLIVTVVYTRCHG